MPEFLTIQPPNYLHSFLQGNPIFVVYRRFLLDDLIKVYDLIEEILTSKNLHHLVSFAKTVVKEMVQNAVKATQKRVFFEMQGLDIQKEYQKGMELFPEFLQNNKNIPLPENYQFSAEIRIEHLDGHIWIYVKNPGEITEVEKQNIQHMLERGKKLNSVAELLESETKQKEGGGIGLSMIIVLSKSLGLPFPLSYTSKNGFTEFCLKLPIENKR
jgi:hypothetical protein